MTPSEHQPAPDDVPKYTGVRADGLLSCTCPSRTRTRSASRTIPTGSSPAEAAPPVSYRAVPPLAPRAVLAPLSSGHGLLAEGLELVERNDDLLNKALTSEETDTYDDRYYVRVDGRNRDGSSRSVRDGWYSTLSKPDTVVLGSEVLDNPEGRYCTLDGARVGWDL